MNASFVVIDSGQQELAHVVFLFLIASEVAESLKSLAKTGQEGQSSFLKRLATIALTLSVIALSQHLIPASLTHWQFALQRLYYVPTILAALYVGWRGGLIAGVAAALCYVTSPFVDPARAGYDPLDECLEVTMFGLVGGHRTAGGASEETKESITADYQAAY